MQKITRLLARGEERLEMVGDGRRTRGVGAGGGLQGTARVMSHDLNLAGIVLEAQALGL